MNILLDAYYDQNFGDDIFIKTITEMFPSYKFYSFLEYYPQNVSKWGEKIPNLYLLPECSVFLKKNMFDAYICVGGDIFPDKGDFSKRKDYVAAVKQCQGVAAFIGFSLFHEYSASTRADICELMENADIVAPRDEKSAELLRSWMPDKQIWDMADLAFGASWPETSRSTGEEILGISYRKPNYADEAAMRNYCDCLTAAINGFLKENDNRRVKLFSLSNGLSPDSEIAGAILQNVTEKDRVQHINYAGDIEEIDKEIAECSVMVCTRLHAMIACIAMQVPFVPIVYEVKQEHILQEIGFKGETLCFKKPENLLECIEKLLQDKGQRIDEFLWNGTAAAHYLNRSSKILKLLKESLSSAKQVEKIIKTDMSGAFCQEKVYGKEQAEEVSRKNTELYELGQEISRQQELIASCQKINDEYLHTIEECNRVNKEYFDLIEELNKKSAAMEQEYQVYIGELQQQVTAVCERVNELQGRVDLQKEILGKVKPYFASAKGSMLTRQMSNLLDMVSKGAKEDWEKIHTYFENEE